MKRKTLDELFEELQISKRPRRSENKTYTQQEVDELLKSQESFLFSEFKKYVKLLRTVSDVKIPRWAC